MKLFGTKDIKIFIEKLLLTKRNELADKLVIDIPAGSGYSAKILKDIGANVKPYDMLPDFFKVEDLECEYADLSKKLPIESGMADFILCQEGIEHLSDQIFMLKEFNRILKKNGKLLLTTPNNSKLRSKLSYFLSESEYFQKMMPPNELDSIWFSNEKISNEIYYGHIFLIGIQKLRIVSRISGFKIRKIYHFRINHTSLFLFLLCYPFILAVNILGYLKAMKNKNDVPNNVKKKVYSELLKLSIDPRILLDGHLIVEFEKENELNELGSVFYSKYKDFNVET